MKINIEKFLLKWVYINYNWNIFKKKIKINTKCLKSFGNKLQAN